MEQMEMKIARLVDARMNEVMVAAQIGDKDMVRASLTFLATQLACQCFDMAKNDIGTTIDRIKRGER